MEPLDNLVRELRANAGAGAPRAAAAAPPGSGRRRAKRPQPESSASGRGRKWMLIGGTVLVALLGAIALLPKHAPTTELVPLPTHTARAVDTSTAFNMTPSPLQWQGIVEQLDRARGLAFMQAEPAALLPVYATNAAAAATDQAMAQALKNAGAHAQSFPLRVRSVHEEYLTVGERVPRAMLTVVDVMGAYDIVDDQGVVLRHVPARSERRWHVELERSPLWGWVYVSAVSAASR